MGIGIKEATQPPRIELPQLPSQIPKAEIPNPKELLRKFRKEITELLEMLEKLQDLEQRQVCFGYQPSDQDVFRQMICCKCIHNQKKPIQEMVEFFSNPKCRAMIEYLKNRPEYRNIKIVKIVNFDQVSVERYFCPSETSANRNKFENEFESESEQRKNKQMEELLKIYKGG